MEDKPTKEIVLKPRKLSNEELLEKKVREIKIARTRARVVGSQIIRAYEILENIRFDFINDTAFRDMITKAEKSLESAINDFLLSDTYWENRLGKFRKMTPKEYGAYLKQPTACCSSKAK